MEEKKDHMKIFPGLSFIYLFLFWWAPGFLVPRVRLFLQNFHPFWNWLNSFLANHIQLLGDALGQRTEYTCISQIPEGNRWHMQIRIIWERLLKETYKKASVEGNHKHCPGVSGNRAISHEAWRNEDKERFWKPEGKACEARSLEGSNYLH